VALAHTVVLLAALMTLLGLPCAVAVVAGADEAALRRSWSRRGRRETQALRRLDRGFAGVDHPGEPAALPAPPIEQLAFDLRRLDRQRRTGPTRESERWMAAVLHAYDVRLSLACRCLGLTEHLLSLDGLDRDIERLRVEAQLRAAGLALRS
jgi:hypothetical protein